MIEYSVQILSYIAFMAFAAKRLMNYLHALQQEDYDNTRLFRWIIMHRVIDRRVSLGFLFLSLIVLVPGNIFFTYTAIFAGFLAAIHFEKDARRQSKKPLVLTARAKRILFSALLPAGVIGLGGFLIPTPLFWILPIQLLPAFLIAANIALQPYEKKIQKKFADEARLKLSQMRPTVIGITGSFGKTSVKHILGHILKTAAPTLITPGSVNTLMGITRIIREQLEPNHKFFVVEMGAYGPGSIKTLCDFTPPDLGIISAIGHAHYERFKTLETVAQAKYELAQATLARGGTVVVHEKTLRFPYTLDMRAKSKNNFVAIGEKSKTKDEPSFLLDTDLLIRHIEQNIKGLTILVRWKDKEYVLNAPLFGLHHGHNIALAFAAAMTLGIEADDIKAALVRTPQIPHRLEMKHQPDGSIIIDDAYNSNPLGFRSALDLLALLKQTVTGRGILVTPGIVELGSAHDEVHRSLGIYASEVCDIVAIVNPTRIPTFIEGYESTGKGKQLQQFDSFAKARDWLIGERKEGDIILLENDLPDLYERVLKI